MRDSEHLIILLSAVLCHQKKEITKYSRKTLMVKNLSSLVFPKMQFNFSFLYEFLKDKPSYHLTFHLWNTEILNLYQVKYLSISNNMDSYTLIKPIMRDFERKREREILKVIIILLFFSILCRFNNPCYVILI